MIPERNNIWFYSGHRRLTPTPYKYNIPSLHFLKGQEAPKERIEIKIRKVEDDPINSGLFKK